MRRSRAIGPQKWRDPPPRTFPVVTGKREKGCFTMNESTGSTIGYVYVPFKRRIGSCETRVRESSLLSSYFATTRTRSSLDRFPFFFSLHFRFSGYRNEARYLLGYAHLSSVRSRTHAPPPRRR